MEQSLPIFVRSFAAEALKLKRTPLLWIAVIGGIFVALFVFLIFLLSAEELTQKEGNPWELYFEIGFVIITLLLAVPFVILVTSSMAYFEHNANAWKYLYTLPLAKRNFYFSKLLMALALIAVTYIVYFIMVLLSGYAIDFIYPAYKFQEYPPRIEVIVSMLGHSYISILGILAMHYWFSIRWKNFIVPVGIGLLGFIIGLFIILAKKYDIATYFPYAQTGTVGLAFGPEEVSSIIKFAGFTLAEWLSVGYFFLFTIFGYYEEKSSNVK